ncbi:YczE/YyaS/YitT family protein [Aquibacillus albus]|uniref:Membrane protein YczE n=1 Tax=Aquibacillus albus TaxID=1168171 RepID=A0ABS2MYU1_9BACI|nr:YitT family protein [Aquibacillus albus]MBM7571006.1 putative membrane protein YczE [Aquibacillus albus]
MKLIREGFLFYISGILILTLGIALTIISKLGASPFDALLVGLHRTFGLTIGSWEIVVGLTMVLGNALAQKKTPEYYALLTSFITGIGIDLWLFLLSNWVVPQTWISQSVALTLGIIFTGIGVATYLQSKFAPNPMDRSMLVVSELTGWSVTFSRALISIALVILAFFFNGAIGIGTLINALFTGVLIQFFLPYVEIIKKHTWKQKNQIAS